MSKKLPTDCFKWIIDASKIHEEFIKNYDNDNDTRYILKVDIEYRKELYNLHNDLPFLPKKWKSSVKSLCVYMIKKPCYPQ